ncbi:MAG: hypothetical protein IPM32_12960 [Ignavibacteriae bacterium]|nr:hypothetical protein [Ignavibacteriota bacterium]
MQKFSKILTGFSFLDQKWGGIYPGGNYLIIGSKNAGKTLLSLKMIENFISSNLTTALITNQRIKNLEIQASSLYFNIEDPIKTGKLLFTKNDEIFQSLENFRNFINEKNPSVIFIDQLLQNLFFDSAEKYLQILEILEEKNITIFSITNLPQNENSKNLLKEILQYTTGIIQLQRSSEKRIYSGQITIKPNIGHIEGEFETNYKVVPIKGFVTLADNENDILKLLSKVNSEYDILEQNQKFDYTIIYDLEEFKLLTESRKSYAQKTNTQVNIITYKIKNEIVDAIELCRIIQKGLNTGDKISYKKNTVYILPQNNESEVVEKLIKNLDKNISDSFKHIPGIEFLITKRKEFLTSTFILN